MLSQYQFQEHSPLAGPILQVKSGTAYQIAWLLTSWTMAHCPSKEEYMSILCHVCDDYGDCILPPQLF